MDFKTSHRMTVPVGQLELGMYVAELDRPWEETPFLFQGFHLETEDDIRTVQQYCDWVVVDQVKLVRLGDRSAKRKPKPAVRRRPIEEALPRAEKTFHSASRLVRSIMDDVRFGRAVDTKAAQEVVSECVDCILENQNALMLLTRIRQKDEYTSEHSLSVSILSISLGRTLGMEREQLEELGMCGLLHDVGKIVMPDEVLKKPGRLTDEEMEVMKQHPVQGRDILLSADGLPLAALDVAHGHHERLDGNGYPRGFSEGQLGLLTKMVSITDTYDAITSDRIYDTGRTHIEAFKILSRGGGQQWDTRLVLQFITTIGVYPPGTLVELSTGELGVVLESNPKFKLRPKILVLPPDRRNLDTSIRIDLATMLQDVQGKPLNIVRVHNPRSLGIDLKDLRLRGLLDNDEMVA